jgi:predicted dithiol-disulfide oxidoreductase (DUF899 family)
MMPAAPPHVWAGLRYHTYSRFAADGDLLAPYYCQLIDLTPRGHDDSPFVARHDEYTERAGTV